MPSQLRTAKEGWSAGCATGDAQCSRAIEVIWRWRRCGTDFWPFRNCDVVHANGRASRARRFHLNQCKSCDGRGAEKKPVEANPWLWAAPTGRHAPIVPDIADTAVARGKLYPAKQCNHRSFANDVSEESRMNLIDRDSNPSLHRHVCSILLETGINEGDPCRRHSCIRGLKRP